MRKIILICLFVFFGSISFPQNEQEIAKQLLSTQSKTGVQPSKTPTSSKPSSTSTTSNKTTSTDKKAAKTPTPSKSSSAKKTTKSKSTTVKSARKASTSRKRPQASKSSTAITSITMTADYDAPILFFDPSDITVVKDEKFITSVIIINPKLKPFSEIDINIKYNPEFVKFLGIGDKSWIYSVPLKDNLSAKINPAKGIINIRARLKDKLANDEQKILMIQWQALDYVSHEELFFITEGENRTKISDGGIDILGDPTKPDDGFINAGVQVLSEKVIEIEEGESEEELEDEEKIAMDLIFDNMPISDEQKFKDASLFLASPQKPVKVGDVFPMDVYLINPNRSPIDQIDLYIIFDKEYLNVEDYDEDNWITLGTNILDGKYHETFPFDYHIENEADNKTGTIKYKVGISNPDMLPKKGKFATIYFKAIKPNPGAKVKFITTPAKKMPSTALKYMGHNLLISRDENSSEKSMTTNLKSAVIAITQ